MYSNNDNHGIQLIDIAGDVTLVRTTADNNDANNGGIGDGVNAMDGTDGDLVAVGGNLSVQGARLRRLTGGVQRNGMAVTSVAGSVTFQDSTGTVQSMDVTGNMTNGVLITDGGTTATFTNGTYSNTGTAAGHDGIDLASFSGAVTLTGVAADTNADTGIRVATTAGLSATNTSASNNTTAGLQASSLTGAVTVDGGTYNTNGDGIAITTAPSAAVSGATASNNTDDGLALSTVSGTVTVTGGAFNDNGGDGFSVTGAGPVVVSGGLNVSGNEPGVLVSGAASFSDTDGVYSNNDNHGIQLIDIAGDVTLVRTTADNNDANNGGIGDGVNAMDGTDGDLVAVGGNLSVQGRGCAA